MQAVVQCSVCASRAAGGLLRNQTDLSLLLTNNVLSRGAASIRFGRKPAVQKLVERRDIEHVGITPLSVGRGLCAIPFTQQMENLSHDSLIRRAASVVTDSSSTFLSQTSLALIHALTNYSKTVHTRIVVQRRYLVSLGKLTQAEKDSFLEVINCQRAEASDRRHECKCVESTWIIAVNLCKIAAEAAQTSGAEQASITVRKNIQVAQSQVEEARKLSADADKKLAETKVEEIQRMAEYTAFLGDSEEHEVQEAYLRED
ncbi:diablo IAP-binding mitochondrial protein-like isoform X2 [Pseudoliparis swirei]|uniref:diablo IAP-binding mitochondrial protein-like isoform X2 n=1 Tax=Pseudoliparis swirei TaxID=2059687 RepID=UPI0024BF025D|nr:diablo IAP-binding mitochondrial protein-like isoform X2 [Pseudoliparis swirei]